MIPTALSIAGSDPSGGAGIQADLKAFSARGVYGMAAITALTAQNTTGVAAVHALPPDFVASQIAEVLVDIRVGAVKVGMIANSDIARAVAGALEELPAPIVVDPVMVAKGGAALLEDSAVEAVRERLLPRAGLVTPNLPEAARLLDAPLATSRDQIQVQATALLSLGPRAVLIKGGHLEGGESPDLLVHDDDAIWIEGARVATTNTHGTGCSLSSAIAAELARRRPLPDAVRNAKRWLEGALAAADSLGVGHGHGPVHHFHALWPVPDDRPETHKGDAT
ncbi:bifunctional hydroxymethylpyrimidine kinase/phosphomethylpyrimidine kinase [Rhodovulum sp. 12E13]|uniref:bifunctional hydroxymethylpyrimidine kinase/phosphomethylpyrimidine kinase n=1 Tax=Rhodovulum sp. 12E13 TaxID=2203891 RepID=UPI000E130384|nr:bifunctional hydroxymethylpyrimidine kinase/phosphomethylpyrimidine kinase [Rhodovulum sp. 12E13]RDC75458.1 bifunctional hydroxymethylpyrimidine kinase/phosphomethylpyrimidine kinase [Rhodovulum sp. 12E13]